ncbi:MAG: S8 family serine peptidase [Pseudomonadota bacterium]
MTRSAHLETSSYPALLFVLAAVLVCLLAGRSQPAGAATVPFVAIPKSAFQDGSVLEPVLVSRRGRWRMRKRFRRHALRRMHRLRKKRRYRQKQRKHKKHQVAGKKPNRTRAHLICIGGRVKARRCRCSKKASRYKISRRIYGCMRAGRRFVVPGIAKSTPDRRSQTAPAIASPQTAVAAKAPQIVARDVLVMMRRSARSADADAVARKFRLEITGQWTLDLIDTRLVRYRIRDRRTVTQVIAALRSDPRVGAPQPNYRYRPQTGGRKLPPADLQYALNKTGIMSAHALTRGRGARIAIVDSGIDVTHPDLASAVEASFQVADKATARPGDHGTAIAGIIRARGRIRGVAPEAVLLDVNVFRSSRSKKPAFATTASILRGLDWALSRRARIINMSLAGPNDPMLQHAIIAAYRNRAIMVAAAGNGGANAPSAYPAAYAQVIAVTATDVADRVYGSANQGSYIAVAAPGVDILAPALRHAHLLHTGTSFAAAHVSGIIALMVGRSPKLTARAVLQALGDTAGDLGRPGWDETFGAGRVNAFKSLKLIMKSKQTSRYLK